MLRTLDASPALFGDIEKQLLTDFQIERAVRSTRLSLAA